MPAFRQKLATAVSDWNHSLPVVVWGPSTDCTFNAAGGASVAFGPFMSPAIRLALKGTNCVRVAIGGSSVVAVATSTLFVAPGVEHIGITPGQYVALLGDDASGGTMNITELL